MKNFRAYNHKNFEFVVNGKVVIITAWSTNTRNGFTHQCDSVDFPEVTKSRICYLNRAWESFEYESVLKAFTGKLPKAVQSSILEQIDNYSELERIKEGAECVTVYHNCKEYGTSLCGILCSLEDVKNW